MVQAVYGHAARLELQPRLGQQHTSSEAIRMVEANGHQQAGLTLEASLLVKRTHVLSHMVVLIKFE